MKIKRSRRNQRRAGFSLAELMVVIVIIGLLATVVVPNVVGKLGKANITKAKQDIVALANAVESYQIDNANRLPEDLSVLVEPDDAGTKYLKQDILPRDPWGNEYIYEPPSGGESNFLIWTYGADGVQGGEGKDTDFNNRMIINGEI